MATVIHINEHASEGPQGTKPDDEIVAPEVPKPDVPAPAPKPREDGKVYDAESDSWMQPEELERRKAARTAEENAPDPDAVKEEGSGEPYVLDPPTTPVPIELKAEEEVIRAGFSEAASGMGLDKDVATSLYNHAVDEGLRDDLRGLDLSNRDACDAAVHRMWGDKTDERLKIVGKAIDALGPKAAAYLNESGFGNAPSVLSALYTWYSGGKTMSADKALAEIAATKGDPKHPYWSGDKAAVARMRMLHSIAYAAEGAVEEEAVPTPAPRPVDDVREARLTEEADALRAKLLTRGITPKDKANAIARIQAIYSELYGDAPTDRAHTTSQWKRGK